MKKRAILLLLVALVAFAGFYTLNYMGDDRSETPADGREETSSSTDEQKANRNKNEKKGTDSGGGGKEIQGRANLPFSKYKYLYRNQEPYILLDFDKDDCKEEKKRTKYSYIEFVFLNQKRDGTLQPFKLHTLNYETLFLNIEKCGNNGRWIGTSEKYATARIKFAVVSGCECPGALIPGKKYRFKRFTKVLSGEYDYRFEVPEADRLDMVPFDSDREPEAFRYPILLNDIKETRVQKRRPNRTDVSLTVKKVISPIPDIKAGRISDYYVYYNYYENGSKREIHQTGFQEDGEYTLETKVPNTTNIEGGNAAVLGNITESQIIPEKYKQSRGHDSILGVIMLMYKKTVSSSEIDMSQKLTYRYDSEKTVMKEISLDEYIKEHNIKLDSSPPISVPNAKLKRIIGEGNQKEAIRIHSMMLYRKNGKWRTTLEAPPGEYGLLIGRKVVDKKFTWPPE